jgi:redox-sensitive transcriptional activator SoxR
VRALGIAYLLDCGLGSTPGTAAEVLHDGVRERISPNKLPADRIPTSRDWARLSGKWTKRIDQRIAELNRLRAGLTQCIGCGCLSIDKCELANPADQDGSKGPAPRYWLG